MKLTDKQREALEALRDVMVKHDINEIGVSDDIFYMWVDDIKFDIYGDMYVNKDNLTELLEQE